MVKNNSVQDNNVLTKSDNESNFPINFRPMPKRFMVWDKKKGTFLQRAGVEVFNIPSLVVLAKTLDITLDDYDEFAGKLEPRYIIFQSTNFFDKDGEEIFEGSVVRDFDDAIGVVYYDREYRAKSSNGDSFELADSSRDLKVLGHILPNPELMEEK